ncbi:oligosaccharide repeat unit polymerase [Vibrio alginolyticus]
MRASIVLLVGLFCNFFGAYIVTKYADYAGVFDFSPFFPLGYEESAIYDSILVFALLITIYTIFCKLKIGCDHKARVYVTRYKRGYLYYVMTAILLLFSITALLNVNWTFSTISRGVGQFDRGFMSAISRLGILTFPLVIIYTVAFWRYQTSKIVIILFVLLSIFSEISNGDRRIVFSYLVMLIFFLFRNDDGKIIKIIFSRKMIYLMLGFFSILISYIVRAEGTAKADYLIYGFLSGTIGGLGASQILAYVKYYVANTTGFLYGETFINYLIGIFTPSFILYAFDGNEFYLRSSYLFNDLFNTNENMGYDFMLLADFYWNFGFFGYFMYTMLAIFVIYFIVKHEKNHSDLKFGVAILLAVYFVSGQRSDFGFFLKSFCYCSLFYWFIYQLTPKELVRIKNEG